MVTKKKQARGSRSTSVAGKTRTGGRTPEPVEKRVVVEPEAPVVSPVPVGKRPGRERRSPGSD